MRPNKRKHRPKAGEKAIQIGIQIAVINKNSIDNVTQAENAPFKFRFQIHNATQVLKMNHYQQKSHEKADQNLP